MIAATDFDGDIKAAHDLIDSGGDTLFAKRYSDIEGGSDWISREWKVPIDDLVEIYKRLEMDVSPTTMRFCVIRGLAAVQASVRLGPAVHDEVADRSKTLVNQLDSYYLGGIDEMSARAAACWSGLLEWFVEGHASDDAWEICDVFKRIAENGGSGPIKHLHPTYSGEGFSSKTIPGRWDALPEPVQRWASRFESKLFGLINRYRAGSSEVYSLDETSIARSWGAHLSRKPNPPQKDVTKQEAAFNRAPSTDEGIKSEAHSKTKPYQPHNAPRFGDSPTYLTTYQPFSQFGTSLAVGRFSLYDPGDIQVAVGAPLETEDSLQPNAGSVYVMSLKDVADSFQPPYDIGTMHDVVGFTDRLLSDFSHTQHRLSRSRDYPSARVDERFGTATIGWRIGNDTFIVNSSPGPQLYIGPQLPQDLAPSGKITIFKGSETILEIDLRGAQLGQIGTRQFGTTLAVADVDGDGVDELIVGSPESDGWRSDGCERAILQASEGLVTIVKLDVPTSRARSPFAKAPRLSIVDLQHNPVVIHDIEPEAESDLLVTVTALSMPDFTKREEDCRSNTYDRFGDSVTSLIGQHLLVVGAPGRDEVFLLRTAQHPGAVSDDPGENPQHLSVVEAIRGPLPGSNFGQGKLATGESQEHGVTWLAIAAPDEEVDKLSQAGVVRIYSTSLGLTDPPDFQLEAELVADPPERFGKFGLTMVEGQKNGLYIGSAFAFEEKGGVWWVDVEDILGQVRSFESKSPLVGMEQQPLRDSENVSAIPRYGVRELLIGAESLAHFGHSLAAASIHEDGQEDLLVGIPYSGVAGEDADSRYRGAVAVFSGVM
jgi:FG-GAP repeat